MKSTFAPYALARFYNSEFLVHIGYELTSIAVIVATASITLSPFADVIIYTSKWDRPLVTLAILVVYLIVGISWFLGFPYALHDDSKFPFSFKYLHARSQYYACVSRLVWDHMGMQKWSTASRVKKLKKRLLGPWGDFDTDWESYKVFSASSRLSYTSQNVSGMDNL
jgi:hypothetical protein